MFALLEPVQQETILQRISNTRMEKVGALLGAAACWISAIVLLGVLTLVCAPLAVAAGLSIGWAGFAVAAMQMKFALAVLTGGLVAALIGMNHFENEFLKE